MKVENLKVGQVIKNYKALCAELNIDIKNGRSRKFQLEELTRYIRYSREGHKYIIEEIYKKPIPKLRKSDGFIRIIELLLLDLLAQDRDNTIVRTRKQLLSEMNMVNSNYSQCQKMVPRLVQHIEVDKAIVYDFYNTSDVNFTNTIERALKSLYDRSCIFHKKVFVCKYIGESNHKVATKEEERLIITCQRMALDEMKCEKLSSIVAMGRWNEFQEKVRWYIQQNSIRNIDYYYVAYEITLNQEGILASYNSILDLLLKKVERKEHKDNLNQTVIRRFLQNAKRRRDAALKDSSHAFGEFEPNSYRRDEKYIIGIEKLLHLLINPNADDIVNDIKGIDIVNDDNLPEELTDMLEVLTF